MKVINQYLEEAIRWSGDRSASTSHIKKIEKQFNIKLPADYVKLVLKYDRALPEPSTFKNKYSIDHFISLKNKKESPSIIHSWYKDRLGQLNIPIAEDGGGNYFVLMYKNNNDKNPVIGFFDHEEFGPKSIIPISKSFREFINELK